MVVFTPGILALSRGLFYPLCSAGQAYSLWTFAENKAPETLKSSSGPLGLCDSIAPIAPLVVPTPLSLLTTDEHLPDHCQLL